ncbi:MAG TPA: hypothetical protein VL361_03450 [Candidatus Limnocylindrales bacterium]|jgi:hypothetical protein|nr:hypothetical protein [Candidatus Limnocylindrales bacterium]
MHSAIQLLVFWALAYFTLCVALTLLNVFYSVIGNDLTLRSLGQEATMAGIASLIEAAGAWLVVSFVPTASRALVIPALIVAIIYKLGHLEDWSRYDVALFLMFQLVLVCSGVSLYFGHFLTAIMILAIFGAILGVIASIAKSL